ncbi:metallophosphatase domain-containing protein [Candidatus Venteria ishoeyi]|uniref:metallophosphatase domain-containing protein n=1 Tax=Candidatus Venteria ishoeyi TaxID=1899563 RepID=UPI0025A62BF6|nr:metallophosphatase domain-containing protein [Candidatus Venteria ishoeyi]MDM8547246.1 metallophosphatase domain-containing protein [Candidatus Venteria ishoeyi]
MSSVKLVFISDTHGLHRNLKPGSGDILIHCGDFSRRDSLESVEDFARFMARQDFKHKIVIAGNHDWCFEDQRREQAEAVLRDHAIHYLNDSGIQLDGLNFWGSPVQPAFMNWAFNRERGSDIRRHWALVPDKTDVLITHGPVFGILDRCRGGHRAGCEDLLATVQRIKPRIHACGHIHESYGQIEKEGILFLNTSNLDEHYRLANSPIRYELKYQS